MILDAIIGLFVSIFALLSQGVALVFVPLINLIAAGIEALVRLFVAGFSMGRLERKKREPISPFVALLSITPLLIIVFVVAWIFIAPKVMKQTVTLVADDGHSLPFAAVIIHTRDGGKHVRTNNAGNVVIGRFGTTGITIKDPRYVEQTWSKSEIESELVVSRTILGSSLDSIADRLLNPKKE